MVVCGPYRSLPFALSMTGGGDVDASQLLTRRFLGLPKTPSAQRPAFCEPAAARASTQIGLDQANCPLA